MVDPSMYDDWFDPIVEGICAFYPTWQEPPDFLVSLH